MKQSWSSSTKGCDIALNRGIEGEKKREGHLSDRAHPSVGMGFSAESCLSVFAGTMNIVLVATEITLLNEFARSSSLPNFPPSSLPPPLPPPLSLPCLPCSPFLLLLNVIIGWLLSSLG